MLEKVVLGFFIILVFFLFFDRVMEIIRVRRDIHDASYSIKASRDR